MLSEVGCNSTRRARRLRLSLWQAATIREYCEAPSKRLKAVPGGPYFEAKWITLTHRRAGDFARVEMGRHRSARSSRRSSTTSTRFLSLTRPCGKGPLGSIASRTLRPPLRSFRSLRGRRGAACLSRAPWEVCHLQCPEVCHFRCPLTGGRGPQSTSFLRLLRKAPDLDPFCEQDCDGIVLLRNRMLLRRLILVRSSTADSPLACSPSLVPAIQVPQTEHH